MSGIYVANEIPQLVAGFPQNLWPEWINNYTYADMQGLMKPHLHVAPLGAIAVYVVMVVLLPRLLSARYAKYDEEVPLFDKTTGEAKMDKKTGKQRTKIVRAGPIPKGLMKMIMFVWNGALCVMSICIVLGCLPPYVDYIRHYGWFSTATKQGTLCDSSRVLMRNGSMNFWGTVFVLSKYAELGDTLLLILKRSDVKVLQWWHHTTVLAFTWYAAYFELSCAWVFICFNAVVHSIMYYYFAMTMGFGWRFWWAKYLTHLQIVQMVVGIATVCSWSYQHFVQGFDCRLQHPEPVMICCFIMYGSYLVLFVQFFIAKYCNAKAAGATVAKAVQSAACGVESKDLCGNDIGDDEGEDPRLVAAAAAKKGSKTGKKNN